MATIVQQGVGVSAALSAALNERRAEGLTQMLRRSTEAGSDAGDLQTLLPMIYDELHRLAARSFRGQPSDHTLQPTALVHEAFIRLMRHGKEQWRDRGHFYAVAAVAMRQILVNHAEARMAVKRGGRHNRLPFDPAEFPGVVPDEFLLDLNEALESLTRLDRECGRVVELRFFGGLSVQETAEVLGISPRSVDRCWQFAKGWLNRELTREG